MRSVLGNENENIIYFKQKIFSQSHIEAQGVSVNSVTFLLNINRHTFCVFKYYYRN